MPDFLRIFARLGDLFIQTKKDRPNKGSYNSNFRYKTIISHTLLQGTTAVALPYLTIEYTLTNFNNLSYFPLR